MTCLPFKNICCKNACLRQSLELFWVYFACLLRGENESEFPTEVHFVPIIEEDWCEDEGCRPGSLIKQSNEGKLNYSLFKLNLDNTWYPVTSYS